MKDYADEKLANNNYDIDIQACSTTDCTGLIPTPPLSDAERESYQELYPYMACCKKSKKNPPEGNS